MLATKTVSPRPAFLGLRASNTNVRPGRMAMRVRAEEGAEKQTVTKASPATLRAEFTSADAIQGEVDRLRAEMFTMRIKFAKREEYQPAQYRALRKRVAQLLTIQRERTVEQGVTLREARAAEKRMMVEAGLRQF